MTLDIVLIGGVSGSGKSVALGALEDAGYYTVNNMPLPLLTDMVRHLNGAGFDRIGATIDPKMGAALRDLPAVIDDLRKLPAQVSFVFLDARAETLVKRFSETRRRHPLSTGERTLQEAIELERAVVGDARSLGTVIDTSELSSHSLRAWIKNFVGADRGDLNVTLQSFGFKHGVPLDSDLVFDVRCLPNPHYESALASLTGTDEPVITFLQSFPAVERMIEDIYKFVSTWLPEYRGDNRNYLTVSIGCTGGRHRSVYVVERLRTMLGRAHVLVRHRELS
ncbi:MAG: RNase adapter RapZ [Betaproteobacteria bacterium]